MSLFVFIYACFGVCLFILVRCLSLRRVLLREFLCVLVSVVVRYILRVRLHVQFLARKRFEMDGRNVHTNKQRCEVEGRGAASAAWRYKYLNI